MSLAEGTRSSEEALGEESRPVHKQQPAETQPAELCTTTIQEQVEQDPHGPSSGKEGLRTEEEAQKKGEHGGKADPSEEEEHEPDPGVSNQQASGLSEYSQVHTATPRTLFEEKNTPGIRSQPLSLEWAFGINQDLPVYSLHDDDDRLVILYGCAHVAVMYNHTLNSQHILQGHSSPISCLCVSEDRRWVATADRGPESLVIIWDSYSGIPVQTLFDSHPDGGVVAMALTKDSKYLVTIGAEAVQRVCIWDWTSEVEGPVCAANLSPEFGLQNHIIFNPNDCTQIASNSGSQVVFYSWDNDKLKYTVPQLTDKTFNKTVGSFSHSVFHSGPSLAFTATSAGNLVVWDTIRTPVLLQPHNKRAVKLIHLQKDGITVLTVTDSLLVTGDTRGHVKFYDENIQMINWYSHFNLSPVRSISFTKELPSPARNTSGYPEDCTLEAKHFAVRNFVISTTNATVVHITAEGSKLETLVQEHFEAVHAVACHPGRPLVSMASNCGILKVWDYQSKTCICSRIFETEKHIQCMMYDPQGFYLGVGFDNGSVYVLDGLTLENECEPFRYARASITHIAFSRDSQFLATADAGLTVTVFRLSSNNGRKTWKYLGRHHSHYKHIQDLVFGVHLDSSQPRLLSLGMDRVLVEYDLNSKEDDLRLLSTDCIEQSAVPKCMAWYPPITKENFILTANDQYKMKLFNCTTKMCRKTLLGPTYGSPIEKIAILPVSSGGDPSARYLSYITKDKVGLQILPLDGNPHKSSALICHPLGVSSFACSCDGQRIFTAGGSDRTVFTWEINLNALEAAASLGGQDLIPFYSVLEGGRDGELFRELEDYFYYCQLRNQGIDTMETRQVSTRIPLAEIPFVMRALGFYPSEQELEDMLNEVKFSQYVDTGKYVTDIDLADFIKLYVNHRPAFGISMNELRHAFQVLGYENENGERTLNRGELLQLLQARGEHMTEEELAEYFSTLMGLNPEGGRLELGSFDSTGSESLLESVIPEEITIDTLTSDILGFPVFVQETASSEEGQTDRESALS
uniref:Cilia- and flagella-associated protein 251 n=1 Tax=Lepisosteus oculatus TaxID=7918 RepID=W5MD80_LEPOC|nr:PREDICTED: WD repeat-containing protein 66 [Lepisosteus oculatus]XP_015221481.1 PREDICTED: WD repeat-containing protein 66 [Lepisosteus oculatus]XP_015221482.1 PREDICTED: WD repeat-containing protein 66 [Lepisosteus oculatus]XP_015221483.1 PREDICTED: WD repeat-containing protein 66 [Lepisosteus oculatus]